MKLEEQPKHERLNARIIENTIIAIELSEEDRRDDFTLGAYLTESSTDCLIYPHQMLALIEELKARLAAGEKSDED